MTAVAPRVFVGRITSHSDEATLLAEGLQWLGSTHLPGVGDTIFIKPNLTWPEPTPGVTTRPEFIEAVIAVLHRYSKHIVICESDGGYGSYAAEEAFEGHGLYAIAERHGASLLNLSDSEAVYVERVTAGQKVGLRLPRVLLEECTYFVTLPVPKVHAMTGVSLGFKNQWGCIPDIMRLRNHAQFDAKILTIHTLLAPRLALYDGKFFLDVNGPIHGVSERMDLIIASTDVGAGDAVCCEIMNVEPMKVGHLKLARRVGLFPETISQIQVNNPPIHFRAHAFEVRHSVVNRIARAAFRRGWLTTLLYDSSLADPLHSVLYTLRRHPTLGRLLYGRLGPPPVEGRRK